MEISRTQNSSIQFDALPPAAQSILQKLEQAGLFRALVVQTEGKQVLLDTAFGQLKGVAPETLNKGDTLVARIVERQTAPTIKIEQILSRQQVLPEVVLKQLFRLLTPASGKAPAKANTPADPKNPQLANHLPQIIKVLEHSGTKTRIQLGSKVLEIPYQPTLQTADTLLLRQNSKLQIELVRIEPVQELKKAISELLPRLPPGVSRNPQLAPLQKLLQFILQLKPSDIQQPRQLLQHIRQLATDPQSALVNRTNAMTDSIRKPGSNSFSVNLKSASHHEPPTALSVKDRAAGIQPSRLRPAVSAADPQAQKIMSELLQSLARPWLQADRLNASTIQQIFTRLTLVKPPGSTIGSVDNLGQQLNLLRQLLGQSPKTFQALLQQIVQARSGATKATTVDARLQEASLLIRHELMQQLEQTSNQLLAQKTSLRLNQEQNQPLQFSLNIPLQLKEEQIPLKLKLSQKKPRTPSQEQQWEIDLDFELPSLGLISTHLLLQESKLSASFWAVQDHTKQLIDRHLHQFRQQIVNSGLEPGLFYSYQGRPTRSKTDTQPAMPVENLLDINV